MNIGIIGTGYVGLTTGACFASLGNRVICVDNNVQKINMLKKGHMPIYEPGLEELVKQNEKENRIEFTTRISEAVKKSDVIFICVNTPTKENGDADLSAVETVAESIAGHMNRYRLIVEKSTVPVETGIRVKQTIQANIRNNVAFDVASNPEFLREGSAIHDFLNPDRVVIGVESRRAEKILKELYKSFSAPIVVTDIRSAEIIKHASNSFLAAKISFINLISRICDKVGADINKVAEGIGLDKRIGSDFLRPGAGFGGFCFPKDLAAFIRIAEKLGVDMKMLRGVAQANEEQKEFFLKKIEDQLWNLKNKQVGVLGLSFKPDTDDIRYAPAIDIILRLESEGVKVKAYDPQAMLNARTVLNGTLYAKDPYDAAKGAEALIILTEWNEFKQLDFKRIKKLMKRPLILDGRNVYSLEKMKEYGFQYISIGRPAVA
ncbi:MAG: UDP-glucose/GDP-mannose dehydrogenase family protein [Candidatus Omnitrophica bacterium]|nr:UDP-glucose/GDP-mannose dehydrogenase family protein [Candidatus Omnitrophota bacterium]